MMGHLKDQVLAANISLAQHRLVVLTWGNVSAIDREKGHVVIKPSGVSFELLKRSDLVVVNLDGETVEGTLNPSSDVLTHIELYKSFERIGAVVHTHSEFACMFAQAGREIPCLGTTHADHFAGPIPITRPLSREEVEGAYESNTGRVIVERFSDLDYFSTPAVLVFGHGPFAWGTDPMDSVHNALIVEQVAKIAMGTHLLDPDRVPLSEYLRKKHHDRKHGKNAYYGQKKKRS
jgi:L-ribulose-5-phosphate 4-epimerase